MNYNTVKKQFTYTHSYVHVYIRTLFFFITNIHAPGSKTSEIIIMNFSVWKSNKKNMEKQSTLYNRLAYVYTLCCTRMYTYIHVRMYVYDYVYQKLCRWLLYQN